MKTRITAADAERNFPDLLNRVHRGAEEFIVVRGSEAVCEIVPVKHEFTLKDLSALLKTLPGPDEPYLQLVESLQSNQPMLGGSPWES